MAKDTEPAPPTKKGLELLQAIYDYMKTIGSMPSANELARLCGVSPSSIRDRLDGLEYRGWLVRERGEQHGIRLLVELDEIPGRGGDVLISAVHLREAVTILRSYAKVLKTARNKERVRGVADQLLSALEQKNDSIRESTGEGDE